MPLTRTRGSCVNWRFSCTGLIITHHCTTRHDTEHEGAESLMVVHVVHNAFFGFPPLDHPNITPQQLKSHSASDPLHCSSRDPAPPNNCVRPLHLEEVHDYPHRDTSSLPSVMEVASR